MGRGGNGKRGEGESGMGVGKGREHQHTQLGEVRGFPFLWEESGNFFDFLDQNGAFWISGAFCALFFYRATHRPMQRIGIARYAVSYVCLYVYLFVCYEVTRWFSSVQLNVLLRNQQN